MSLNEYVTKRCVELEKENNELKKEVSVLRDMNDKMVKLIGKEMRRSFKIISEIDEDEVFDEETETAVLNPSMNGFTENKLPTCHQGPVGPPS